MYYMLRNALRNAVGIPTMNSSTANYSFYIFLLKKKDKRFLKKFVCVTLIFRRARTETVEMDAAVSWCLFAREKL